MATLYATRASHQTTSDLYTVDETTGAMTSVGPIGFAVSGLALDPDGTLYGSTSGNSAAHHNALIVINTSTGAGTLVADLSGNSNNPAHSIAIDSTGQLWGWNALQGGLWRINKATGAVTTISTLSSEYSGGLDFDSSDTLWHVGGRQFTSDTVDTSTGLPTTVVGGLDNQFVTGSFDSSDLFWAAIQDFSGTYVLVTFDVHTGAQTVVGTLSVTDVGALCWAGPSAPTYTLTASPSALSIVPGASSDPTISVNSISGFSELVDLTVTGAPSGVTTHLASSTVTAGGSTTLHIAVDTSGGAGAGFTLTLHGLSQGTSVARTAHITVATFNIVTDYTNTTSATALELSAFGCPSNSTQFDTDGYPASTCTDRVFVGSHMNGNYLEVDLTSSIQGPSGITLPYSGPPRNDITVTAEVYIPSDALPLLNNDPGCDIISVSSFGSFSFGDLSAVSLHYYADQSYGPAGGRPLWALSSTFYTNPPNDAVTSDPTKTTADAWHTLSLRLVNGGAVYVEIDGTDYGAIGTFSPSTTTNVVRIGIANTTFASIGANHTEQCFIRSVKIGTGGYGSGDLYSRDLAAGDDLFKANTSTTDGVSCLHSPGQDTLACWPVDLPVADYGLPIDHQGWFKFTNPTANTVYARFIVDMISSDDGLGFRPLDLRMAMFVGPSLTRVHDWQTFDTFVYASPPSTSYVVGDEAILGAYIGPHQTAWLVIGRADYFFQSGGVVRLTADLSEADLYDTLDNIDVDAHPETYPPTEQPPFVLGGGLPTTTAALSTGSPTSIGGLIADEEDSPTHAYCHHAGEHFTLFKPAFHGLQPDHAQGVKVGGTIVTDDYSYGFPSNDPNKANWPGYAANAQSFIITKYDPNSETYSDIPCPPILNYDWSYSGPTQECFSFFGWTIGFVTSTIVRWTTLDWSDAQMYSDGTNLWLAVLAREPERYPWLTNATVNRNCHGGQQPGPSAYYDSLGWGGSVWNTDGQPYWYKDPCFLLNNDPPGDDAGWQRSLRWWPTKIVVFHYNGTSFDRIGDIKGTVDNRVNTNPDFGNTNGAPTSLRATALGGVLHVLFAERGTSGPGNTTCGTASAQNGCGARITHATFSTSAKTSENDFGTYSGASLAFGGSDQPPFASDPTHLGYSDSLGRVTGVGGVPVWLFADFFLDVVHGYDLLEPVVRFRNLAVDPTADVQTIDTDLIPPPIPGSGHPDYNKITDLPFHISNLYHDANLAKNVFGLVVYWENADGGTRYFTNAIYSVPADLSARADYIDGIGRVTPPGLGFDVGYGYDTGLNPNLLFGDFIVDDCNMWFIRDGEHLVRHGCGPCATDLTGWKSLLIYGSNAQKLAPAWLSDYDFWYDGADGIYGVGMFGPEPSFTEPGPSSWGVVRQHILRDFLLCNVGPFILCTTVGGVHVWIRY